MRILRGHRGPILSLAYSPDSRVLASGDLHGVLRLWEVATGDTRDAFDFSQGAAGPIMSLRFAPSGKFLAVGETTAYHVLDRDANEWRVYTTKIGGSLSTAFSGDSRWLFVGGFLARHVAVIDVLGEITATTLDGDGSGVLSLAHSPSAEMLASGGDAPGGAFLRLWDVKERRWRATLRGHERPVFAVAFSPDGTRLASGGRDQTVRLWNVDRREPLPVVCRHPAAVVAVSFAPDGRTLVSASEDGVIRLWDVSTGRETAAYDWRIGRLRSIAISPDGMTAAAGGSNNSVMIWDLE
jgi:WD40 repeat protein